MTPVPLRDLLHAASLAAFARALAIAVPAGALCSALKAPLPWMIGPLVACAIASGSGVRLLCPAPVRCAGLWAIGTALGLFFTPAVLLRMLQQAPAIAAGVVWSILLGLAFAWALRRFAYLDPPTAFFAGAIGGASEMALQGERNGGRFETIAAVHSLRIMLVVILVPFAFKWLGVRGTDLYEHVARPVDYGGLAVLIAATVGGALVLRRARSPNPWVLGPLLVSIVLTGSGQWFSALPPWMVTLGQLFIGISLGTRFQPGFFRRAPRPLGVALVSTLIGIPVTVGFGWGLGALAGVAPATMVLATAPGGIAEMSLTAKMLGLGVPVVTVFHVARVVFLVLAGNLVYRLIAERVGWPHVRTRRGADRGGDDD
jgi:membrane AbrB-like protein